MLKSLSSKHGDRREDRDHGFTLIELLVVLLVMTIVMVIAGAVLLSLSTTANRNESMVADEQAASDAISQATRDIRSAAAISFPTNTPANQIELVDNQQSGSTQTVMWTYSPTAQTLTRQVLVGSSFVTAGPVVTRVANPNTSPVFSYFDENGSAISGSTPSNIINCATIVNVDLYVAPSTSGVSTFEESVQAALTNQLDALTAPGGSGQCSS